MREVQHHSIDAAKGALAAANLANETANTLRHHDYRGNFSAYGS